MKRAKQIGVSLIVIIFIAGIFVVYWLLGNWTIRYRSELNRFFGKGSWKVISEDVKRSRMYTVRDNSSWKSYGQSERKAGFYREWNILCTNENGEEEVWKVSNHTYKINNDRYRIFSPKRYKAKQALTLELMEISFAVIEEEVHNEIVKEELTEEEAHCIYVNMSYHGGNPQRSFYDKLAKESWFTIDGATAENYLASELYDFYLLVRIHDYRLEQLSEQKQENVINSLENIEKRLLEKYGNHASFEILHDEYKVEYVDGVKQMG